MLENDTQYHITQRQRETFEQALEAFETEAQNSPLHPVLLQTYRHALQQQITDLRAQVEAYTSSKGTLPS